MSGRTLRLLTVEGVTVEQVQAIVPSYVPECWVASYDPAVGLSSLTCTTDPDAAWTGDALALWRSVCSSDPVRPDGRPNRPLTAFTVEVC